MKKLNMKRFTLIEFLTITVIFVIIIVVTAFPVLNTLGDEMKNNLQNSANTVDSWIEKEYIMAQFRKADEVFSDVCGDDGSICESETDIMSLLNVAGVKQSNYSSATVIIGTSGRACVKLTGSSTGDFSIIKSSERYANSTAC